VRKRVPTPIGPGDLLGADDARVVQVSLVGDSGDLLDRTADDDYTLYARHRLAWSSVGVFMVDPLLIATLFGLARQVALAVADTVTRSTNPLDGRSGLLLPDTARLPFSLAPPRVDPGLLLS
jgi:hypothetical protein